MGLGANRVRRLDVGDPEDAEVVGGLGMGEGAYRRPAPGLPARLRPSHALRSACDGSPGADWPGPPHQRSISFGARKRAALSPRAAAGDAPNACFIYGLSSVGPAEGRALGGGDALRIEGR